MLYIYNSLTRKKEPFVPMVPGKIGLYVCGVTVYDHCHLGHARSMVGFDVVVRFLRAQGFDVNYVRNITDIDDKIIARAGERQVSIQALTQHYIDAMHADTQALGILPPSQEPRATEHIQGIVRLIERLIQNEHAYVTEQGDVCYEVARFEAYGKLAHKDIEGLVSGARVEIAKDKRSPLDFVLWKLAKPGEPSWPSPWGEGRPGWHIECSAMAMSELGEQFDIHGGGLDLQFPHHENEIAQSEGATGKPFANYWMHVGMLQVNNEKMAKSLGNFFTISNVLQQHNPEAVRYFLLSAHYRSPLNYSQDNLSNAGKALTRLYQSLKGIELDGVSVSLDSTWVSQFNQAMEDDFNTPEALSVLFRLSHEVNKTRSPELAKTLQSLGHLLGLLTTPADIFLQAGLEQNQREVVLQWIEERNQARKDKNWTRADELRQLLLEQGVELEDSAQGTTWRYLS